MPSWIWVGVGVALLGTAVGLATRYAETREHHKVMQTKTL